MEIVHFTPEDQQTTVSFMKSIARGMGWPDAPVEFYNFEKFFHLPDDGFFLLVKHDGTTVGTAGCIKLNENDMLLKRFYIAENLRGSGIAKKLFASVLHEAKKFEGNRIVIDVRKDNPRAIRFYEKVGFKQYNQKQVDGWNETKLPHIFNYYSLEV